MKLIKQKFTIATWVIQVTIIAAITFTFIRTCDYLRKPMHLKAALICEQDNPCRYPYPWE